MKCSLTAGKSLPSRISWQGFSRKSLQSSELISFVNCSMAVNFENIDSQ
ncbi:hypothetical protein DWUX_331 [Desulfovibrio diazotrophicus]|nr:hypothetical protein DWUX_331 [Desulfovibrio diazotrophicus]